MYSQFEKLSQHSSYQQQSIHDLQQRNKDLSFQLENNVKAQTEKIFDFLTRQLSQHSSDIDMKLSNKAEKSDIEGGVLFKKIEEINGNVTTRMKEMEKQVVKRDQLKEILQTKVVSIMLLVLSLSLCRLSFLAFLFLLVSCVGFLAIMLRYFASSLLAFLLSPSLF
jgi:hypothetical protein